MSAAASAAPPASPEEAVAELLALDAAAVDTLAASLAAAARGLAGAADALGAMGGGSGEWTGEAADAAWTRLGQRCQATARAADAFEAAGRCLRAHAAVLVQARHTGRALAARLPEPASPAGPAVAEERAAVLAAGRRAREEVAASGAAAAAALRATTALAPPRPGWHEGASEAVDRWLTSALFGAGESLAALAALPVAAAGLTPARAAVDPEGSAAQWGELVAALRGLGSAVVHRPGDVVAAVLDVATWREDPARALGRLLPEAVAAAAGVGAAVTVHRSGSAVEAGAAASAVGRRGAQRAEPGPHGWQGHGLSLDPEADAETRALAERARAAEPEVSVRVTAAREQVGAAAQGWEHRLKDVDSLRRKVAEELLAERTLLHAVDSVGDTIRFTLELDEAHYAAGALAAMRALRASGAVPVKVRNAWTDQRPYRGINTTWGHPGSGVLFEVQLHTPASYQANKATRDAYELGRLSTTPAEVRAATDREQRRVWAAVPVPPGAAGIDAAALGLRPAGPRDWAAALAPPGSATALALATGPAGPTDPPPAQPASAQPASAQPAAPARP